jgi:TetR/AcrR family fatty acid metabolism transcriptional regulator
MATSREDLIKEYRVSEILDATRRVIGRHGFQGATIDRVAEEAKVAKGTIYLYFETKESLLHAAVTQGFRANIAELNANGMATENPVDRIKSIVRQQFRQLDSAKDFVKAVILDSRFVNFNAGDPLDEELRALFIAYLDFLASVLKEAIDRGAIRPIDPQLGAFMLNEMIIGTLRRRLLQLTDSPLEADEDAVLELFLKGVQAAPCH